MIPVHSLVKGAGLAAVAAGWLIQAGLLRLPYPDSARFPVRGLDVSQRQGEIDWSRTSTEGLSFAYVAATEGVDGRDARFQANWRGAQAAGLAPGAVHAFALCRPGAAQARNFLEAIGQVRGPMLPPAVELTLGDGCASPPSAERLKAELEAFLTRVEEGVGATPVLRLSEGFFREYSAALPARNERWVRSLFRSPDSVFGAGWTFWQFASRARVPGVRGPVDLDAFRGSENDWRLFLREKLRLHPEEPAGTST